MVEAAISSLENQAKQAKQFEEQQQQQQMLQSRLTPLLLPEAPDHLSPKEHIINYQLINKPMDELQSQLPVTHNPSRGQAQLSHRENVNKREATSKIINYKVVGSTAHKSKLISVPRIILMTN